MGNCRALHADTIGMRRLDSVIAHGGARHKAVTRGNRADQELFGSLVRSGCICRSINKPTLSKHIGSNIDQRRRRAKLLESRCRLGDKRGIGIQIAQAFANDHVVDMELGVQTARDTRKHNSLRSILANEVLCCSSGVHRAHARRCGDNCQTVELTAHNGQACLPRLANVAQLFLNLHDLFFERTDNRDGSHTIPQTYTKYSTTVWYQHFV